MKAVRQRLRRSMRLRLTSILSVSLSACVGSAVLTPPAPVESFEQMLQRTEHIQCTNLLHADGGPLDCRLAYDSWVRAREKYATIAPSVKDIPMGAVTIFRPENVRRPLGQAPRFCCAGDGTQPVQGLFFTPNVIHVAHERVIYCEALHYFAFVSGDAGWIVTGHNEPGDVLHFPCWQVVEQEYLTQ